MNRQQAKMSIKKHKSQQDQNYKVIKLVKQHHKLVCDIVKTESEL